MSDPTPSTLDPELRRRARRFCDLFEDLSPENVERRARDAYAPGAVFHDTLTTKTGVDDIAEYLLESARACESCGVEILDIAAGGQGLYVRWRMTMRLKKVARGRDLVSLGVTHLVLDSEDRIARHHDYWDAAGGLFEHLPLVGWMIRKIKARF